jgi:hypothetical protein
MIAPDQTDCDIKDVGTLGGKAFRSDAIPPVQTRLIPGTEFMMDAVKTSRRRAGDSIIPH